MSTCLNLIPAPDLIATEVVCFERTFTFRKLHVYGLLGSVLIPCPNEKHHRYDKNHQIASASFGFSYSNYLLIRRRDYGRSGWTPLPKTQALLIVTVASGPNLFHQLFQQVGSWTQRHNHVPLAAVEIETTHSYCALELPALDKVPIPPKGGGKRDDKNPCAGSP